jgi:activating signal cointegrator 1
MKALTLHQPYATAIALGCKRIETRGHRTHHRGPVAIHASAYMRPAYMPVIRDMPAAHAAAWIATGYEVAGKPSLIKLPQGCIVAIAEIYHVRPVESLLAHGDADTVEEHWGNYAPGRFGWLLRNIRRLATPIEARGQQGLWDWQAPADLRFVDSVPSSVICPPSSSASQLPVLPAYRLPPQVKRPPFAALRAD